MLRSIGLVLLGIEAVFACVGGPVAIDNSPKLNNVPPVEIEQVDVPEPPQPAAKIDIDMLDPVLDIIGEGVTPYEYDPAGYNSAAGGPVDEPATLDCDFDGSSCCWTNAEPPLDQINWQLALGVPEWAKMRKNFGPFDKDVYPPNQSPPMPTNRYLIAVARASSASDEAQFVSCSIPCSSDSITVTARHWSTKNVLLQVCTRVSFFNDIRDAPLLNCEELPRNKAPGPTTVSLGPANLIDIVFVASNMIDPDGDAAIIDDVVVNYTPCGGAPPPTVATVAPAEFGEGIDTGDRREFLANQDYDENFISNRDELIKQIRLRELEKAQNEATTPKVTTLKPTTPKATPKPTPKTDAPPPPPAPVTPKKETEREEMMAVCTQVTCDFENSPCNYKLNEFNGFTKGFKMQKGQFMNKITGITKPGSGGGYLATYLLPRETAQLQISVDVKTPVLLAFRHWVATNGLTLKVCCNGASDCDYSRTPVVRANDREWHDGRMMCPAGTDKIFFICENSNFNQGACGIDNVQVFSPEDPDKALCKVV